MSKLKFNYLINLRGNVSSESRKMGDAVSAMSRRHDRSMRIMSASSRRMSRNVDASNRQMSRSIVANIRLSRSSIETFSRYSSAALTAVTAIAVKNTADLEERVIQLGINFGKTGKDLRSFASTIVSDVGYAAQKWHVSSDEIFSGLEQIAERTGKFEYVRENIENLAISIGQSGASGKDFGNLISALESVESIKTPDDVLSALDSIVGIGEHGSFVLKHFAKHSAKLFAIYSPQNERQIRELGAAIQFVMTGIGSDSESVSSFDALMRTFTDKKKLEQLAKLKWTDESGKAREGIQIFDPEKLKEGIEKVNIPQIINSVRHDSC